MMSTILELLKEANKHPFYTLILGAVVAGWIQFSLYYFAPREDQTAQAEELKEVSSRLDGLVTQIQVGSLEQKIHTLEAEQYAVERIITEGTAHRLDHQRLARIRSDLGTAKRDLERLQ